MNDIVNDRKGHNIVNDKIAALYLSQKPCLLNVFIARFKFLFQCYQNKFYQLWSFGLEISGYEYPVGFTKFHHWRNKIRTFVELSNYFGRFLLAVFPTYR